MYLGISVFYIRRSSPDIPIALVFTIFMDLVYALQNEFQPFLRFDYCFLSSAYIVVPFCVNFLLFNYIILWFSYDWCCMFIFFHLPILSFLFVNNFYCLIIKLLLFNYKIVLFFYHWYCMFLFFFITRYQHESLPNFERKL